jgi:hypothetical protein
MPNRAGDPKGASEMVYTGNSAKVTNVSLSRPAPPAVPLDLKEPASHPTRWLVHRRASPQIIAENQRLEALWLERRAAERAIVDTADAKIEALLRDLVPVTFAEPPSPLAIGIHRDLIELLAGETDEPTIARFLRRWTRRVAYQRALAAGEMRLDLNGLSAGYPTPEQRSGPAASAEALVRIEARS